MLLMIVAGVVVAAMLTAGWAWDQKKRRSRPTAIDVTRNGHGIRPKSPWWTDPHDGGSNGGW